MCRIFAFLLCCCFSTFPWIPWLPLFKRQGFFFLQNIDYHITIITLPITLPHCPRTCHTYLWESYNVLQSKEEEEPFVGKQWAWCAVANAAVSNLTTKRRKRPERPRLFISQGSGSIQDLNKGKLRIKIPTTRVFGPKVAFGPDQIQQQNLRPNCQSINFKLYIVNKALIICGKQYIILILRKILCLDHRCFTSPVPEH